MAQSLFLGRGRDSDHWSDALWTSNHRRIENESTADPFSSGDLGRRAPSSADGLKQGVEKQAQDSVSFHLIDQLLISIHDRCFFPSHIRVALALGVVVYG